METSMEFVVVVVGCVLAIAAANTLAPRIRLAAPLLLVAVGVIVSFIPRVPEIEVDPEIILMGVLPPLLYAAAVAMPVMDFRRDVQSIGLLSIVLVIISALVLGAFFSAILPEADYATGVALGAILSPTDAVATGTIKRVGAPARITTLLSGESLFNDASSLVVLRAAIAASAASVSFGGVAVSFVWSLVAAIAVGAVIGWLHTRIRGRLSNPAVATAVSFTAPYIAYIPAELIESSGLVAAVAAGLVSGQSSVRRLTAAVRQSDMQNWRMVEVVLEGAVFLIMGLELKALLADVHEAHESWVHALWPAIAAFAMIVVLRLLFMVPLMWVVDRRAQRLISRESHLSAVRESLDGKPGAPDTAARRYRRIIDKRLADIDYYRDEALGPKESLVVVWGGMRGVVTLAAAQTLPADTPYRSLLILVAFFVAVISLTVQSGTIAAFVRSLKLPDQSAQVRQERAELRYEMLQVAQQVLHDPDVVGHNQQLAGQVQLIRDLESRDSEEEDGTTPEDALDRGIAMSREMRRVRGKMLVEQRKKLLELRDRGAYSSEALTAELAKLDAEEISITA
ncbi:cation:proton antiporter [Gordonia sp. VNK21]|uniref:cation:proton antiporter n=1 Tax=Gordonia sp. VNK21 TaxID=3382483 RepID=UPI0038D4EE9D